MQGKILGLLKLTLGDYA